MSHTRSRRSVRQELVDLAKSIDAGQRTFDERSASLISSVLYLASSPPPSGAPAPRDDFPYMRAGETLDDVRHVMHPGAPATEELSDEFMLALRDYGDCFRGREVASRGRMAAAIVRVTGTHLKEVAAARVVSLVPDAEALTRLANEIATRLVCDCREMEMGDGPRRPFEHFTECRAPRAASEVREYLRVQFSRAPQGGPR